MPFGREEMHEPFERLGGVRGVKASWEFGDDARPGFPQGPAPFSPIRLNYSREGESLPMNLDRC